MFQDLISRQLWLGLFAVIVSAAIGNAIPFPEPQAPKAVSTAPAHSLYAPQWSDCPTNPLVRPATGVSENEQLYVDKRKRLATAALRNWLEGVDTSFDTTKLPTLAMASSGGGYRSMLIGGGLVQALDKRGSSTPLSGLYQAFTYHAGLSGGAWLLSSLVGNSDAPTIDSVKKDLWYRALANNSIWPSSPL